MKTNSFSKTLTILVVILFALLIAGCEERPTKTRKPSLDWSRGLPLGTNVLGSVGIAVDENGKDIHAVWPLWSESKGVGPNLDINPLSALSAILTQEIFTYNSGAGGFGLHYAQIDENAQIKFEHEIIQISGQARLPQLISSDNQNLHLFWTNRKEHSEEWQLWYGQLDRQGNLQETPIQLSSASSGVSEYEVVSDLNGGVAVVWEDTKSGGINFTHISSSGEKLIDAVSVVSEGTMPAIRVDSQNRFHLVWFGEKKGDLMYQVLDSPPKPKTGTLIAHIPLGSGPRLYGPALGITDQWIYVIWSILKQSGVDAGSAETQYIAFPVDAPEKTSPISDISILPLEEQPYEEDEGNFKLTQLVPAEYATRSSDFVYDPIIAQSQNGELAVALAFRQEYRLDAQVQVVVVIMANGEYTGYTVATKTPAFSSDPALAADKAGNLHLIWRDGYTGENIYYASTASNAKAVLDKPVLQDLKTLVLAGGMESFAGILLFPLASPWLFPGLVLVVFWRIRKNDETLDNRISQIILIISLLLYQGTKVLIFPTIVEYVPLSAWIDIPFSWKLSLRIATPLLILGIAVAIAERKRRVSQAPSSTLSYYFTVALVDMILTLSVYGVNFLGAY